MNNRLKGLSYKCLKKAKKAKYQCIVTGCNEIAINSHVIWKKGILSKITKDSHLYSLSSLHNYDSPYPKFKRIGINDLMSFPGLCIKHDQSVFREIESTNTDYSLTSSQLLLAAKSLFHEMRKKQVLIQWYRCMIESNLVPESKLNVLRYVQDMMVLGMRDLSVYVSQINDEYRGLKKTSYFLTKELTYLPIAASSVFSTESSYSLHHDARTKPHWKDIVLNNVYFNLIPLKAKSVLVIGFSLDNAKNLAITERIRRFDQNETLKFISDVLIQRIETWAVSEDFYRSQIEPREELIIKLFSKEYAEFSALSPERFNLFSNYKC